MKPVSMSYSRKNLKKIIRAIISYTHAAGLGLEPRLPGPEPDVLPLDDPAMC